MSWLNDGLLTSVYLFFLRGLHLWPAALCGALPGPEGQEDTDPELALAFHLVLEEQSSGCVHMKSCPRENW